HRPLARAVRPHRGAVVSTGAHLGEERSEPLPERARLGQEVRGGPRVERVAAMEAARLVPERERRGEERRALRSGAAAVLLGAHDQRPGVGDGALQLGHETLVHGSFYNRASPLLREAAMPAVRPRARRTTIREVLETAIERAFEMAIDIEASELEDVVVDMMKVVKSPEWRERAIQLLIHDLGDLSFMIERYTPNDALLARADALVERRVGGLGRRRAARRV